MPALVKSTTPLIAKNEWRTPSILYNLLDREFGFQLDAAATVENSFCKQFFTIEDDALIQDWGQNGIRQVFCNPPFTHTKEFLAKGIEQYREYERELEIVFLIRADGYETQWFRQLLDDKRHWFQPMFVPAYQIRQLVPRVPFFLPSGSKPSHGPNFPSAVVVMSKHHPPGMYWWFWKQEIVERGLEA